MFKKIVILLLPFVLSVGCIKEDPDSCQSKLRMQFRYTYNNQRVDQLASQVGEIRVFLFDQTTGLLTDIIRVEKESIERGWIEPDIPDGIYTAVAWGVSGEDMIQGGYLDAEMTNPQTHRYLQQLRIGITTLDNFRMMLETDALSPSSPEQVLPINEDFNHLFFAIATNVLVGLEGNRVVDFDFIKNTSTLRVRITGLEHLSIRATTDNQPLYVHLRAPHERYLYDNTIDPYSREVHYEPPYKSLSSTRMIFDMKIQRLDIDYHSVRPVLLYIRSKTSGQDMILPLDVLNAILHAENEDGDLLWPTQEDIDREELFLIEISILHDLSITVTVQGFEIEDMIPDIDRD